MFGFCPLFTHDAEATSLPCQHRAKQKKAGREDSGGERRREAYGRHVDGVSNVLELHGKRNERKNHSFLVRIYAANSLGFRFLFIWKKINLKTR